MRIRGDGAERAGDRSSPLPDLVADLRARLERATDDGVVAVRDLLTDLGLADELLLVALQEHCAIEAADIPQGTSVFEFVARVARVGARGVTTDTATDTDAGFYGEDFESHFPEPMEFSRAVDEHNGAVDPATEFRPDARRIYASFPTASGIGRSVLVKWSHVGGERIYLYRKARLERGADVDHVWLQMPDGWGAGMYAVEIYSLRNSLAPLAGGRYFVR